MKRAGWTSEQAEHVRLLDEQGLRMVEIATITGLSKFQVQRIRQAIGVDRPRNGWRKQKQLPRRNIPTKAQRTWHAAHAKRRAQNAGGSSA